MASSNQHKHIVGLNLHPHLLTYIVKNTLIVYASSVLTNLYTKLEDKEDTNAAER